MNEKKFKSRKSIIFIASTLFLAAIAGILTFMLNIKR